MPPQLQLPPPLAGLSLQLTLTLAAMLLQLAPTLPALVIPSETPLLSRKMVALVCSPQGLHQFRNRDAYEQFTESPYGGSFLLGT